MQRLKIYYREKLLDMLKACAKKSSESFSTMLKGMDVFAMMTGINLKPVDDLFNLPDDNIVVVSDIIGDLAGTIIISFKAEHGMKVINALLGRDPEVIADMGEHEMSALKEYTGIVAGAYLSEFGNKLGYKIIPQVPQFEGKVKDISEMLLEQIKAINHNILFINSSMVVVELDSDAVFYILFDENSLNLILNMITKGDDDPFEEAL